MIIPHIRSRKRYIMSKLIPGNQKHLSLQDRITIEKALDQKLSFRNIASVLCKDPTTISKEIKAHRITQPHNSFNEPSNKCAHFKDCKKKNICGIYAPVCKKQCRSCSRCNSMCSDFIPKSYACPLLDKAPFVCNGCSKKSGCRLDKSYYRAATANRQYKTVLVESRNGINISEKDLQVLDSVISPLIRQGQSPYLILKNHPEIHLSEKTIYNYIECGALSVKNLDLPKKVKYKMRSPHPSEIKDTGIFEGRTYKDFTSYMEQYPETNVVEMDTVVGCEGTHKVLLTLFFRNCHLMLIYLLDDKKPESAKKVFDMLEKKLSTLNFCITFPVILTDRGGEFSKPETLECGINNVIRTSIYYCDPMASWQKPGIEKNHEYIRKILPKGSSFDNLTQFHINKIMNHINSTARASLNGLSPIQLAQMLIHEEAFKAFGLHEIKADNITLTENLLK